MAVGDFLSGLNLAPEHVANLTTMIGPPAAPVDPYGAPTPEEMARYGATPSDIQVAQNANAPAAAGVSVAAPSRDVAWTPEVDKKRDAEGKQATALAGATPQGPAGSDGFPTYRDLNSTGSAMPSAPSGPAQFVKAAWQPSTRGESVHYGIDEAKLRPGQEYREEGLIEGQLANQANLQAAEQRGMADAVYAASNAAASKRAAEEMQRIENEKRAYVMREQEKLESLNLAAAEKVDPEAAKGSAGAQLMATIAIALGQFGASLNGGPNTAMQMVNADIDRRIAAQRDNITNAGKMRDREQSLYAQNLAAFGDKERATLATKVQYLDQVKAMADQQYAGAKHTMNEAQYHAINQKLLDERAETLDKFGMATADRRTAENHEKFVPAHMVGGGAAGAKGKEALYVPTAGGYARDPETARKLNGHAAMRTQINEDLHEIHSLLDKAKGLNSISNYGEMQEVRQRIDALKHGVLQKTTVLAEQGAMSKGDQSVAEARSGLESVDPQLKTEAQIKRMQKALANVAVSHQRDARLEAEANGIQLGTEQYTRDAAGNPTPVSRLAGQTKVVTKKSESVDDLIEKPKGEVKK